MREEVSRGLVKFQGAWLLIIHWREPIRYCYYRKGVTIRRLS